MGRVSRARCLQLAVACWVVMAYVAFSRFIEPTGAPVTASSRARTHRDDHRDAQLRAKARQRAEPPRRARLQAAMGELQSRLRAFDGPTSPALTTAATPASASTATAAPDDGMELDPRTSLLVPRFWQPPPGMDLDAEVEKVDGRPTILVMIASYRDFQCAETVSNALLRAKYPRRLSFAIVQQNGPDDASCDAPELPCETAPEQPLCVHKRSVHAYTMDASKGTGPVYARHVGARMYRGEAFVLQIDAHVQFVVDWDVDILRQWRATHNEYAIISTYLTDLQGSLTPEGVSKRTTRPIMCVSGFKDGGRDVSYLRHGAQPEERPMLEETPMLQPFWAAGFSFSRGHFIARVPYDCCLPWIFQGEEISMGIRAWSHGYDTYAPARSVTFHEYASMSSRRKKVKSYMENEDGQAKQVAYGRSMRRLVALAKLDPTADPASYSHDEEGRYGLGNVRDVDLFFGAFRIDRARRRTKDLCHWVRSAKMHRTFSEHMRADGKGINYTALAPLLHSESPPLPNADAIRERANGADARARMEALTSASACADHRAKAEAASHLPLLRHVAPARGEAAAGRPARIFCLLRATHAGRLRAAAAADTWMPQCDGAALTSSEAGALGGDLRDVPSFATPEGGGALWQLLLKSYPGYDYYAIASDGTFFVLPNLRAYLADVAPTGASAAPLYLGRRFRAPADAGRVAEFNSGAAGIVLSSAALEAIDSAVGAAPADAARMINERADDVAIASYLRGDGNGGTARVTPAETRDDLGRERFLPFSPGYHWTLRESELPSDHWYRHYSVDLKYGADCCSNRTVSFVLAEDATGDETRRDFALLNGCRDHAD